MLLAVCDVLVIKALEAMGKFLVRTDRGRYTHMIASDIPMHLAHTIWTASDEIVSKATRGAWDVVPLILDTHGGCCEYDPTQVTNLLDGYVHDLVITGTPHDLDELEYRLRRRLNLPVYNHEQEAGSQ